jgi:dsRNA-specific ribonuclease
LRLVLTRLEGITEAPTRTYNTTKQTSAYHQLIVAHTLWRDLVRVKRYGEVDTEVSVDGCSKRDRDIGQSERVGKEVIRTTHSQLVNKFNLLDTRRISLGEHLLLGCGEAKGGGRENPTILENAFEALLGAIYLDSGKLDTVARFLIPFVRTELQKMERELLPLEDYKTLLQQYVQQTPGEELRYETVSEEGPDNAKTFTVRALINSNCFGTGTGSSKKEAEQNAAKEALKLYLPKSQ